MTNLADNNADFQRKPYGPGMTQNYPFVVCMADGRAGLFQRQPGSHGSTIWRSGSTPLTP